MIQLLEKQRHDLTFIFYQKPPLSNLPLGGCQPKIGDPVWIGVLEARDAILSNMTN